MYGTTRRLHYWLNILLYTLFFFIVLTVAVKSGCHFSEAQQFGKLGLWEVAYTKINNRIFFFFFLSCFKINTGKTEKILFFFI